MEVAGYVVNIIEGHFSQSLLDVDSNIQNFEASVKFCNDCIP